jgi:hypothetical protein
MQYKNTFIIKRLLHVATLSAILLLQLWCGVNEVMSWPQKVLVQCLAAPVAWSLPRSFSQVYLGSGTHAPLFPPLMRLRWILCHQHDTHFAFFEPILTIFPPSSNIAPSQVDKGSLLRLRGLFVTPTFGHIPQWQNLSPYGLILQVSYTPLFVYSFRNLICIFLVWNLERLTTFSLPVLKICVVLKISHQL